MFLHRRGNFSGECIHRILNPLNLGNTLLQTLRSPFKELIQLLLLLGKLLIEPFIKLFHLLIHGSLNFGEEVIHLFLLIIGSNSSICFFLCSSKRFLLVIWIIRLLSDLTGIIIIIIGVFLLGTFDKNAIGPSSSDRF